MKFSPISGTKTRLAQWVNNAISEQHISKFTISFWHENKQELEDNAKERDKETN